MQFAQILAIKQQMTDSNSIDEAMDFISSTYYGSSTTKHFIDLEIENGRIVFPSFLLLTDLTQQNTNIETYQIKDTFFASNFDVNIESIMNNSVGSSELNTITNLKLLKNYVRDRGLSIETRHIVWPLLLNVLPFEESKRKEILKARTEEYLSIRNQWKTFSKLQIKNFSRLSRSFSTIREDVIRTTPHESVVSFENWDIILTNILRSFSLWNLNVGYTQGMHDLGVKFMGIFLPQVSKGELTLDEMEALSFWCLSSFVEKIDGSIIAVDLASAQTKEIEITGQIIEHFHPICFNWLKSNFLDNLLFIRSSLILAYSRSFHFNDVYRIWESIISSESPSLAILFITASIIIHCFPHIMVESEHSMGRVHEMIDKLIIKLDIGSAIGVALAMMDKKEIKFQKNNEKKINNDANNDIAIPENEFFTLDTTNALKYRNNGNLFI